MSTVQGADSVGLENRIIQLAGTIMPEEVEGEDGLVPGHVIYQLFINFEITK